jgi:hypothetical protein
MDMPSETSWLLANSKLEVRTMKAVQTCEVEAPPALSSDKSLMIIQCDKVTFLTKKARQQHDNCELAWYDDCK